MVQTLSQGRQRHTPSQPGESTPLLPSSTLLLPQLP